MELCRLNTGCYAQPLVTTVSPQASPTVVLHCTALCLDPGGLSHPAIAVILALLLREQSCPAKLVSVDQ